MNYKLAYNVGILTSWTGAILHKKHGRRKVHDYFLLLLCKSSIWFTKKHIIIIYFFNTSKCAANYVISFEVYDGFIDQKILKLWRQESLPFSLGWAAYFIIIQLWTFRFQCPCMISSCTQVHIITPLQLPVHESWIWIDPLDYLKSNHCRDKGRIAFLYGHWDTLEYGKNWQFLSRM